MNNLICILLKYKRQLFYTVKSRFEMATNIENHSTKHPLSLDWVYITELPDSQLFQHLKGSEYKMNLTSSGQIRYCNAHQNLDDHKMKVAYYQCSSKFCIQRPEDKCPVRRLIKRCEQTQLNYIYVVLFEISIYNNPEFQNVIIKANNEHSNMYKENAQHVHDHEHGMNPIVRAHIIQALKDRPTLKPSTIKTNLLIESQKEGSSIFGVDLPDLDRIRRLKYYVSKKDTDNKGDRDKVEQLIKERGYTAGIDPNKGFIFAARNGTGADDDPLTICITALNWLTWLNSFVEYHQIYHCDGTYKIVRNRFPVIVFGRSDVSGQFHPIAIALTSRETADDYEYFFR